MYSFLANHIAWLLLLAAPAVIAAAAAQPRALPHLVRIESKGYVTFYSISPDARTIAYAEAYLTDKPGVVLSDLVLIDITSGRELRRSASFRGTLVGGVFSRDGKSLAPYSDKAYVWDVGEWKQRCTLELAGIPLAFSADGKLLVGVTRAGDLTISDLATSAVRYLKEEKKDAGPPSTFPSYTTETSEPKAVTFADDGAPYLFVEHHGASPDIRQWNFAEGKPVSRPGALRHFAMAGGNELMQYRATEGRNVPGSPVARLRFRAAPSGQVLVLPRYKVLPVAAVPYPDGTIALVAVTPGSTPYPGSKEKELARLREFQDTTARSCILSADGNRLVAVGIDPKTARTRNPKWVLIVWDVSHLHGVAAIKPKRPSDEELGSCWGRLADPGLEYAEDFLRAMFTLASFPEQAVPFLKEKVGPPADLKPIAGLIKDLDSSEFPARARATRELERLGQVALPYLEKARVKPASAEAAKRIEQLVKKLQAAAMTDELRYLRIIDILEHISTPAARELLETIAGGGYGPAYAAAANAALQRKLPK